MLVFGRDICTRCGAEGYLDAVGEGASDVKQPVEAPAVDVTMADASTPVESEQNKSDTHKQPTVRTSQRSLAVPQANDSRTKYTPYRVTILEPLSATGLRAIRYAKEIPLVKSVSPPISARC